MHKHCAEHCIECGVPLCRDCATKNRARCKSCFDVTKPFKRIRRSYLQDYLHCPYNLYLNAVLGKVPPMGGAAQSGVLLHKIFEDVQLGNEVNDEESLIDRYIEEVEEWNKSLAKKDDVEFDYSLITDERRDEGIESIKCWLREVYPILDAEKFEVEYNIKIDVQEESLIGCTQDRIEWENEGIHIHDWKTGKPLSGKQLIENLQPAVYIYAVYKEFGEYPISFTLHYVGSKYTKRTYWLQDDGTYAIKTKKNVYILNVEEKIEECREIIKKINNGQFPTKGAKWFCKGMCWYNKSGDCTEGKWRT